MSKEVNYSRKGNKCLKWCLVRYLHPVDKNPARIRKISKDFSRKLHFKDIKLSVKIRDIHKVEKMYQH